MKNYKLCVVGAGSWGKNHIKTLEKLGSLGGVVDLEKLVLKNKKEYPKCLTFFSLDDSFKYNFDAYIIATPPNSHYALAKKVIEKKETVAC